MSFVGSYTHTLDAKNRVFIPAKFREELGEVFYITRKFNVYLSVYTEAEWEAFVDKISELPESEAEELQDFLLGAAQKCIPDANGRIVLDEKLMRFAKIDKSVVFVGAGKQIRIFSEEEWNERERNTDPEKMRKAMSLYHL